MYKDVYSEELVKKLSRIKKKDRKQYTAIRKKMDNVLINPQHKYKDLHYSMKGIKRVHIGHFVLIFRINHAKKLVSFEDYDHHDKIYA